MGAEEEALPKLNSGQVLIQQHYISLDPAMRGWMNDSRSYIPPVALGEVMRAGSVGQVIEVNGKIHLKGDYVTGWGEYKPTASPMERAFILSTPNGQTSPILLEVWECLA